MKINELEIDDLESLLLAIRQETEYLQTTEGDEVECISIESLDGILKRFFNNTK